MSWNERKFINSVNTDKIEYCFVLSTNNILKSINILNFKFQKSTIQNEYGERLQFVFAAVCTGKTSQIFIQIKVCPEAEVDSILHHHKAVFNLAAVLRHTVQQPGKYSSLVLLFLRS